MQTPIEIQLQEMRKGLDLRPDQIDTSNLLPIFIPASFVALGNWMGPYDLLRAPGIVLTWSVALPDQTMRYMDPDMKACWESQKLDWRALAMQNLANQTPNWQGLRALHRPTGELSSLAFMFEDGYGPSRLLFRGSLSEWFPQGYRVAIPEMSAGFAFAKDLDGQDLATVTGVIDHCYRSGTRPLAPGTYDADDLLHVEQIG